MLDKYMIGDSDGNLYDTSQTDWHVNAPIRPNYCYHHTKIESVADLKATLRAGRYTSSGSYPLFFITEDDGVLSFETVRSEYRNVLWSIQNNCNDGWKVSGCEVNWESEIYDDHTGELIESAYGIADNC